ncbi:hypothetical protein MMC14_004330 [Varicellaria rhodocarpa]|nr:hypothetical protein [Varicellaria rhodocarpa]
MVICLSADDPNNQWPYCPSTAAATIFAVLFGLTTLSHIIQAFHYRKGFCWVIIMGGSWETAAFILRILSIQQQASQGLYEPQFILILVAPLWINAFDYMVLGRMVHYFLPGQKIMGLNPRRMALIFVLLDITAFIVQLGGAFMTTTTDINTENIGLKIYTGGVGLQEAFILFFLSIAVQFHIRIRASGYVDRLTNWKALLYVLYGTLTLITVRVIFRIVEFAGGINSSVPHHQVYAYIFDSLPMVCALVLLNIVHPGRILVGPESEFPKKVKLSKEEKRRVKEDRKQGKRGQV